MSIYSERLSAMISMLEAQHVPRPFTLKCTQSFNIDGDTEAVILREAIIIERCVDCPPQTIYLC